MVRVRVRAKVRVRVRVRVSDLQTTPIYNYISSLHVYSMYI